MKKKTFLTLCIALGNAYTLHAMNQGQLNKKLVSAIKWGSSVTVADLIAQEADTNYQADQSSLPVLCTAIKGTKLEKIALLVAHGANINQEIEIRKSTGSQKKLFEGTPLLYAAFHFKVKAVKQLLSTVPQKLIEACSKDDERDAVAEHLEFVKKALNTKTKNFCQHNGMGSREEIPYVLLFNATNVPSSKERPRKKICDLLDPEKLEEHKAAIKEYVKRGSAKTLIIDFQTDA